MEILHGALRTKNPNACFFIRNCESLKDIPVEYHEKFFETNQLSKLQMKVMDFYFFYISIMQKTHVFIYIYLKVLKEKLKEYHSSQVHEYFANYEGIDKSTKRDKVKLGDLIEFGQIALKFLISSIERTYPNVKPIVKKSNDDQTRYEFNHEIIKEGLNILFLNNQYRILL